MRACVRVRVNIICAYKIIKDPVITIIYLPPKNSLYTLAYLKIVF